MRYWDLTINKYLDTLYNDVFHVGILILQHSVYKYFQNIWVYIHIPLEVLLDIRYDFQLNPLIQFVIYSLLFLRFFSIIIPKIFYNIIVF